MFEKPPEFEKRAQETDAPAPSRSPWEPLTMIGVAAIAIAVVVVTILLVRAF